MSAKKSCLRSHAANGVIIVVLCDTCIFTVAAVSVCAYLHVQAVCAVYVFVQYSHLSMCRRSSSSSSNGVVVASSSSSSSRSRSSSSSSLSGSSSK